MTIIVYDDVTKTILVDSLTSWDNGRPPATVDKVRTSTWKTETVVSTSSGPSVISNSYLALCLAAIDDQTFVAESKTKEFSAYALFFAYKGKLWMSEARHEDNSKTADVVDLSLCPHDVVAGSGGVFHAAYIAAGHSVIEATRMAVMYHETCGLPLRYIRADGSTGLFD